jgi:V8-like Glu-specific endopeptidase
MQKRLDKIASRYTIPPAFDPAKLEKGNATRKDDWAVLYVTEPFPTDTKPLRMTSTVADPGTAVEIAGYGQERLYIMTADHHCRIAAISTDRKLIAHDCATQPGDSGGPLLSADGNGNALVLGVNVGGSKPDDAFRLGIAVSAASITEFLAASGSPGRSSAPIR